jgi:hypothetical protein
LESLLYEKLVIPIKKELPVVAGWEQYRLKAKLEVKNFPLAERTWKLKNHTTLNLFWRPLSLDNSLVNVGCHITTNMQQNAAFSNQLEERSPTWPSARHSVMESRKRNRNGWQWWFHGCQMSLSLSGRVFAFKSTGSFIEQSWIYKKK